MKKVMLMLAFCGALVTMSAQTTKSDRTKKEGTKTEQSTRSKQRTPYRYEPRIEENYDWEDEMTGLSSPTYSRTPSPLLGSGIYSSNGTSSTWKIGKDLYASSYTKNYRSGNSTQKIVSVIVSNKSGKESVLITASGVNYKNRPVATMVYTREMFTRGTACKTWDIKNLVNGTNQSYAMCSRVKPAWVTNTGNRVKHAYYSDSF